MKNSNQNHQKTSLKRSDIDPHVARDMIYALMSDLTLMLDIGLEKSFLSVKKERKTRKTRSQWTDALAELNPGESIAIAYKAQTYSKNRVKFRKHLRACASYVNRAIIHGSRFSIEKYHGGVFVTRVV